MDPMLFSGISDHKLDPQHRISIPSRFRDAFKAGIILTKGFDQCIVVYTPSEWESMAKKISEMPTTQTKARQMMHLIFWGAFQLEMDRQGRVPLQGALRDYANIQDEVVIAGTGRFIEIWNKESWYEQSAILDEDAQKIAEKMEVRE